MRRILIASGIAITALVVAAIGLALLKGPTIFESFWPLPSPDEMYPSAPPMPPVVATPVEELLAAHEAFLRANAKSVVDALQPGLSDAEIDRLEVAHSIKLTGDLRALYRWRNGTPRAASVDAFPNHEFVPLDAALAAREELRAQVNAGTPEQRRADAALIGHRDPWVGVIVDLAGDGYFFDPTRSESQGSFFFSFGEDGSYTFYPAFRNYLAAVVDGEKSGVFIAGPRGVDTSDFVKAQALWERFGTSPQR